MKFVLATTLALLATGASASTWMYGDNDGYGIGAPDNGNTGVISHYIFSSVLGPGPTYHEPDDGLSDSLLSSGAVPTYTDAFHFSSLAQNWTTGYLTIDTTGLDGAYLMGTGQFTNCFRATTCPGAIHLTPQLFDGQPGDTATKVRTFQLPQEALDYINANSNFDVYIGGQQGGKNFAVDFMALSQDPVAAIPEPATYAQMALGMLGLGGLAWRRRSQRKGD